MLELFPSILFYSLIACIVACVAGLALGWLSFKFNFTAGMILSGVLGFALAVQLVFWAFKVSSPEKAWVVLLPLMITVLAFTVGNTVLFFFNFKYQLGQVIENAKPAQIENATAKQLFFKLSEEAVFDIDQSLQGVGVGKAAQQTLQTYGRNKTRVLACRLIDSKNPQTPSKVWFLRAYSILTPEAEAAADFNERVKKLKTDFQFFIADDWAYYNISPFPEEMGKDPIFLVGADAPATKLSETRKYLLWSVALQNLIFIMLSLALSPLTPEGGISVARSSSFAALDKITINGLGIRKNNDQ